MDSYDECGVCPAFEMDRISEQIVGLPEEVNFKSNINWKPIYETDQASGKLLFSGLEFKTIDDDVADMLEVNDEDLLRDYIRENVRLTYFEHKVITLTETEWSDFETEGTNEKIEAAGWDKWELITVVNKQDKWYCVFKREQEYEPEDQEDESGDND